MYVCSVKMMIEKNILMTPYIRFSNPCRLRYLTQELVFFREDLLQKMQRFDSLFSFYDRSFLYAQITQYYCTRHLVVPLTLPDDSDDVKDKYVLEDIFEAKTNYS